MNVSRKGEGRVERDKELHRAWTSLMRLMPPAWVAGLRSCEGIELRARLGQPLQVLEAAREVVLPLSATEADIEHLVSACSGSSLYAYEEEMKQGFITLPGGHRVGFAGKVMLDSTGHVRGLKHISAVCLRVARSIPGSADGVMKEILDETGTPYHTLIVSPPQAGKTTLLRDIARQVSLRGKRVCIVDERSEIAGCYRGRPELDVGPRTDVLDGCPKAQGMLMALRSLSPQVLITDEIGRCEDVRAMLEALHAGVRVVATAHGSSLAEVGERPHLSGLMGQHMFRKAIVLSHRRGPGTIEYVGHACPH